MSSPTENLRNAEVEREIILPGISLVVYDLHHTIVDLAGDRRDFYRSLLYRVLEEQTIGLISSYEGYDYDKAAEIFLGLRQMGGDFFSLLAKRYNENAFDVYEAVWESIEPDSFVQGYEVATAAIKEINRWGKKQALLTNGPPAWTTRVLRHIGLPQEVFDGGIFTAADFKTSKSEILALLAIKYAPSAVLSVGDTHKYDIGPAQDLGMKAFAVSHPVQIQLLLTPEFSSWLRGESPNPPSRLFGP